jgi:hypothetical protein
VRERANQENLQPQNPAVLGPPGTGRTWLYQKQGLKVDKLHSRGRGKEGAIWTFYRILSGYNMITLIRH